MNINVLSCVLLGFCCGFSHAACNDKILSSAPNNRYLVLGDGSEIKDVETGLIWQRCSIGQSWNGTSCIGEAKTYGRFAALKIAYELGNGYRLPNIKELQSLVEEACYSPSINTTAFPNVPKRVFTWVDSKPIHSFYISSSPYSGSTWWHVDFYQGGVHVVSDGNYYVRAVRTSVLGK